MVRVNVVVFSLSLVFSTVFYSFPSHTEIIFEGYSKVMSSGAHVGYIINRYELDAKTNQFISTSLLKTNELAGNITESLKAYATKDLFPIKYSYTAIVGNTTKTIDAEAIDINAKKNKNSEKKLASQKPASQKLAPQWKLIAKVKEGGKEKQITLDLPNETILSTFLVYWILQKPDGLKINTRYTYKAIAEEDGTLTAGIALVKEQETIGKTLVYKIQNEFKESKFNSTVSERGEVLSTSASVSMISTELVKEPKNAIGNFSLPTKTLQDLFGGVPSGKENLLAKIAELEPASSSPTSNASPSSSSSSSPSATATATAIPTATSSAIPSATATGTPIPGKQIGIPGGKGIHIKGQPQ